MRPRHQKSVKNTESKNNQATEQSVVLGKFECYTAQNKYAQVLGQSHHLLLRSERDSQKSSTFLEGIVRFPLQGEGISESVRPQTNLGTVPQRREL